MDILSIEFLTALLAIVVIDLVLAGDNAIVIALASRSLPKHLQKRAIVFGAVGAIIVRSAMTLVVVWLLKIPGLLALGGALLLWIAYRLLTPEDGEEEDGKIKPSITLRGAIQTIIVADLVMGLDNVLAVAGAAQGSYVLVVLGLLISVPIVVWGSTILLHWVERFPVIIYLGAAVLAWTSAKMIMSEPFLKDTFNTNGAAVALFYIAAIGGVLWSGFVRNHRRLESRISSNLAVLARPFEAEITDVVPTEGENAMLKVLVPVDGSRNSEYALRHVVNEFMKTPEMEIHLINVQPRLSRHIGRFLSKKTQESYHRDEAEKRLGLAKKVMDSYAVPYSTHIRTGDKAAMIVEEARRLNCQKIVMGTARKNSLTRMLEDSTTNNVLEQTSVPVEVIAGDSVSKMESYGIPTAFGTTFLLMIAAVLD